ncbi:hypothetical protein EB796_013824 [Bugula neritina]|uniref:Uncharacterized protein n=1 Tax=Bugula neritina TaxID=10212 RepID=A0A7J7JPE8_BUGNE|nr:hypothetical protein EB796_013824 [Bugula neritina]
MPTTQHNAPDYQMPKLPVKRKLKMSQQSPIKIPTTPAENFPSPILRRPLNVIRMCLFEAAAHACRG